MDKCRLKIVENLEELIIDPEFFRHISTVNKYPLDLQESSLHLQKYNFVYINQEEIDIVVEDSKICAIIRFFIIEWEGIKYAFIDSVGSRAYYDLEYKGYGRKIFNELFDFLKEKNVKMVCIFDFTVVGYEMYLKIGFRVIGADKFLYKMLNDEKISCDDVKYVLTIDIVIHNDYKNRNYSKLNTYAKHDYYMIYEHDRYGKNPYRPFTDPVFVEKHTDLMDCEFDKKDLQNLFKKMTKLKYDI